MKLNIGCTAARHAKLGIHAVINARGGMQHLNSQTIEDIEMIRDARKIQGWKDRRVCFYQFNSKHFRKAKQVQHLLSSYED
jgi:hypothetical protein